MCLDSRINTPEFERRILGQGEIGSTDNPDVELCLRIVTVAADARILDGLRTSLYICGKISENSF